MLKIIPAGITELGVTDTLFEVAPYMIDIQRLSDLFGQVHGLRQYIIPQLV